MGLVPVLFVCQSPGEFDSNGVVLVTLGHIITYQEEDDSQQQVDEECGVKPVCYGKIQRIAVDTCAAYQRTDRANHQDEPVHFGTDILVLWVE